MDVRINPTWKHLLVDEFTKPYFKTLTNFVKEEYKYSTIFPPASEIFTAFDLCPVDKVRVVILGQDPYHGQGQAHGLCFSVNPEIKIPPSLVNIFKEIKSDLDKPFPPNGDLRRWAQQGVLLLNSTLTVRESRAGSHQKQGWEQFTDKVISKISETKTNIVFLLWGNFAKSKSVLIDSQRHLILEAAHPSPFSAYNGFFGCRHFSKTNTYLREHGLGEIEWGS